MSPWWLRPPSDSSAPQDEPEKNRESRGERSEAEESKGDAESDRGARQEPPRRAKGGSGRDGEGANDEGGGGEQAPRRQAEGSRGRRGRRGGRRGSSAEAKAPEEPKHRAPVEREPAALSEEMIERIEEACREAVSTALEGDASVKSSHSETRKIALFCDLENIALGVRDDSKVDKFDIHLVLERLVEKGKIIVKRAYADWQRYKPYKQTFHEAGIELIDIPQKHYSGKNSADIKMVVDAMDLCFSKEHLEIFVIISGDSDFSPLVSKLKENDKYVIGLGVKSSSSNLLIDNCDEFIYYEDVWRDVEEGEVEEAPSLDGFNKKKREVFKLLIDATKALMRENYDRLWGSMVKQTMQRKKPSFNERYYGYSTFSDLLEDAEKSHLIHLKKDQGSGSYIITGFSSRRER